MNGDNGDLICTEKKACRQSRRDSLTYLMTADVSSKVNAVVMCEPISLQDRTIADFSSLVLNTHSDHQR